MRVIRDAALNAFTNKVAMAVLLLSMFPILRVSAYYDPGVQRWVNRDPVDVRGGINLHAFVNNRPTTAHDRFGFTCEDPCGQAKQQGINGTDPAGTVCCEGAKYACVWNPAGDPPLQSEGAKRIAARCLAAHEDAHVKDPRVHCPHKCGCGNGVELAVGRTRGPNNVECAGYRAEIECYDDADCGGDPQCIKEIAANRKFALSKMESSGCDIP
jgi:hypothetical protein